MAAHKGHVEVIKVLASLGANIDSLRADGSTPLHVAAAKGHKNVVKLLRKLGAVIDADSEFGTPADVALEYGNIAVAEKLTKYNSCCAKCGRGGVKVKLSKCGKCQKIYYCSSVCQQEDWPQHKLECIGTTGR